MSDYLDKTGKVIRDQHRKILYRYRQRLKKALASFLTLSLKKEEKKVKRIGTLLERQT